MKTMRKRVSILILCVLCLLSVCTACKKKDVVDEPSEVASDLVFPDGYTVAGVSVAGMTAEEAKEALSDVNTNYTFTLTINSREINIETENLSFVLAENADFNTLIARACGEDDSRDEIVCGRLNNAIHVDGDQNVTLFEVANDEILWCIIADGYKTVLSNELVELQVKLEEEEATQDEVDALNEEVNIANLSNMPGLSYDGTAETFVGVDGSDCVAYDYSEAVEELKNALTAFGTTASAEVSATSLTGKKFADSVFLPSLLDEANSYLDLNITIHFSLDGYEDTDITVGKSDIASWLGVNMAQQSIALGEEAISVYASDLARAHDHTEKVAQKFRTTGGGEITVYTATGGNMVDENALFTDLCSALGTKESKVINAVFNNVSASVSGEYTDFGGTYCELDLTNQRVYVYKNGVCVVNSPCVSGCVSTGHATPTGVYSIFSRDRDRYLTGADYHVWVDYFCPFNGGIGFHDASWRGDSFGGTYYFYSGSHGCVNLPLAAAQTLYESVSVGTKVIVYGGVTSVPEESSMWTGETYHQAEVQKLFAMDMKFAGDCDYVYYECSDTSIATVDANGYVLPIAPGTCTITACAVKDGYTTSMIDVTVVVIPQTSPATYSVTVLSDGNGTVSVNGAESVMAEVGSTVILTVTPNEGYRFVGWDGYKSYIIGADNTFVMPVGNLQFTAIFEPIPAE